LGCVPLLAVVLALLLASCADLFQSKIPMPGSKGTLNGLFEYSGGGSKLEPPEQFHVEPYYSSSEIRLTWHPVRYAAYYVVERAVALPGNAAPGSEDYEPLNRVYDTAYRDEILKSSAPLDSPEFQHTYFYRVSAFNTALRYDESEPTAAQPAMLFRPPVNVTATGGASVEYVDLRWDPSPGARDYEIWRSDFMSGTSASLLGTTWDVPIDGQIRFRNSVSAAEQGRDFYYMIIARNSFGNKTPQTRPAYGYARVYGAPEKPKNVSLAANSGRGHSTTTITIQWDAVDEPDAYYAVYRYSETDSSLTRLTDKTASTNWPDTAGLKPGVYYYYRVQAIIDDISSGKAMKSEFSIDNPEAFLLSSPDEVIAEKNSNGTVTVKWKPAKGSHGEQSQYRYQVYTGSAMEGDLLASFGSEVSHSPGTDGYISTTGYPVGNYTFFRVTTLYNGIKSGQSMVVSPSPAAAIIEDASQHAYINENANSNGVYPVKITWKKPANENPAFYHIQRSQRTGSGFAKINDEPLGANGPFINGYSYDSGTGVYTYIDRNEAARVGRKYYYRVLSLNQLEQGSFPSDERVGWGALTHTQYLLEYNKTMNSALKKLTYMHKPGSTEKLGTETKYGGIGGSIYYNAAISGLGARIIIQLTNYAEFYIENVPENGIYFTLSGYSNTSANMSSNGTMDGTVTCTGMYPGTVSYDRIEIKGGDAGGGTYGVEMDGFGRVEVPYTVLK
jgi:hypothetical protein